MLRPSLIALLLLTITTLSDSTSFAQATKFPLEAVVEAPEAYVRSGPGERFYPTAKLQRGTKITVVRKDFGGWYMILPPAGSFSWVRAEYVDQTQGDRGQINTDNVVVRVGSAFGNVRDVEQRRLQTGDPVQILGAATLDNNGTAVKYLKISPPQGEYRWILGEAVVAASNLVRRELDNDPYRVPSDLRRAGELPQPSDSQRQPGTGVEIARDQFDASGQPAAEGSIDERPIARFNDQQTIRRTVAPPEKLVADRERLKQLDDQFRSMIRLSTEQWDFTGLEQGYQQLLTSVASPALKRQVELRFPALEKYQRIKSEYDAFVLLTRETQQRDAQLLSMQQNSGQTTTPSTGSAPDPSAIPAPTRPPATSTPPATNGNTQRPHPKFVGAGIVQRLGSPVPGRPQFVLVAPNGRLLAYLQADQGVDLNSYVGQSMGVGGRRWYRADLRGDFILVRSLTAVRLKSAAPGQ